MVMTNPTRSVTHQSARMPSQIVASASATAGEGDIRAAMRMLQKAWDYALDLAQDPWLFAIEIHRLRSAGLSECDLRWLVLKQLVVHGFETTPPQEATRRFARNGNLGFSAQSCFVLTREGVTFAAGLLTPTVAASPVMAVARGADQPVWDTRRRMLLLGTSVVKHFRVPAPIQETILNAFAEENWVSRVDDPLPTDSETDAKRRVQSAIMCLNRNQRKRLIRFRGDGTGTGIIWEPVLSA